MNRYTIENANQALAYVVDCHLATLEELARAKSPPKYEFQRQLSIAQSSINWMVQFKVDFSDTRAIDVQEAGSVIAWVNQLRSRYNLTEVKVTI